MKKILLIICLLFSVSGFSKAIFSKTANTQLQVQNPEFVLACSAGLVEGCRVIRKFGINPGLASGVARDVWDWGDSAAGNVDYTYPTDGTAPIDTLSGSSAADTMAVIISGLDIAGNDIDQFATVAGQAKVTLTTPLWRIYRIQSAQLSNTADRSLGFAGNLYVYEDTAIVAGVPTDKTKVRAYIFDGNNQTQMTQYTIPKGETGFIIGGSSKMTKRNAASIVYRFWARPFGSVFRLTDTSALNSLGTGAFTSANYIPSRISELTDIVVSAESDAAVGIAVAINILLLDNTVWKL